MATANGNGLITKRQAHSTARRLYYVLGFDGVYAGAPAMNYAQAVRVIQETLTPDDLAVLETFTRLVKERVRVCHLTS